jgi:hypothetical protein
MSKPLTDWICSSALLPRTRRSPPVNLLNLGDGGIAVSTPPPAARPSSGRTRLQRAAAFAAATAASAPEGAGVAQAGDRLVADGGVRAARPVVQHPRLAVAPVAPPRHRLLQPPHPQRALRADCAPRQLHPLPRPHPPARALRRRPRGPARPRRRRVLHALRAPQHRLRRHLLRHDMGRHPWPRDLLPAVLGGRRPRLGRPADRPLRHRDLRPPPLHPPRHPPRHRPELLPRPRHPTHHPRHGLQ